MSYVTRRWPNHLGHLCPSPGHMTNHMTLCTWSPSPPLSHLMLFLVLWHIQSNKALFLHGRGENKNKQDKQRSSPCNHLTFSSLWMCLATCLANSVFPGMWCEWNVTLLLYALQCRAHKHIHAKNTQNRIQITCSANTYAHIHTNVFIITHKYVHTSTRGKNILGSFKYKLIALGDGVLSQDYTCLQYQIRNHGIDSHEVIAQHNSLCDNGYQVFREVPSFNR